MWGPNFYKNPDKLTIVVILTRETIRVTLSKLNFWGCIMKVTIEDVSNRVEGVWSTDIDPQRLLRLADPVRQGGRVNIAMVTNPFFDNQNSSLQFDLDTTVLLNLGSSYKTYFIDALSETINQLFSKEDHEVKKFPAGDNQFLEELKVLPESIRNVGEKLLKEIRMMFPGELVYHPKSKKFVESPDNFWVIRVQPRAKSLRIIVYGKPEDHRQTHTFKLKHDMAVYSNFVIDSENQIQEAVNVIRDAKLLKDDR